MDHTRINIEIPQESAHDVHTPIFDPTPEHVDSIPCECRNSSFVVILNVLKCTACKRVREYIILSSDSSIPTNECTKNIPSSSFDQEAIESSITSDIEKTFEDEDERRAAPTTTSFPIIEGQLFEPNDYDIFLKFEQEAFMFKVIFFSAACSFLVHTDKGWKNNQYLLAHLYNDSAQPFTFIVLSHRNLHELPRSLTNVVKIFHETFVIPRCSMHVSSRFMSNVARLCGDIRYHDSLYSQT